MNFRHEIKHEITLSDMITIRQRLRTVAYSDPHTIDGKYFIRSLYFDNYEDKALRQKIDGVNRREKFRIRCYNGDISLIRLEKKSKLNGLGTKQSAFLTAAQTQSIISGNLDWMLVSDQSLIHELYSKMRCEGIRPKTIVDYTREPFIFPAGNVRITLDYDIRSGLSCTEFLNKDCVTVSVSPSIILEVKWDAYLPDIIRDAISLENRREGSFSKYATCRIYD